MRCQTKARETRRARGTSRICSPEHLFSRHAQKHDRSRFGGRRPGVTGRSQGVVLVESKDEKGLYHVRVISFAEVQAVLEVRRERVLLLQGLSAE